MSRATPQVPARGSPSRSFPRGAPLHALPPPVTGLVIPRLPAPRPFSFPASLPHEPHLATGQPFLFPIAPQAVPSTYLLTKRASPARRPARPATRPITLRAAPQCLPSCFAPPPRSARPDHVPRQACTSPPRAHHTHIHTPAQAEVFIVCSISSLRPRHMLHLTQHVPMPCPIMACVILSQALSRSPAFPPHAPSSSAPLGHVPYHRASCRTSGHVPHHARGSARHVFRRTFVGPTAVGDRWHKSILVRRAGIKGWLGHRRGEGEGFEGSCPPLAT